MAYIGDKYSWQDGLTSGREQALTAQNDQLRHMAKRLYTVEHDIMELHNYIAEQTPFNDEAVSCEWCNYSVCQCDDKKDNPDTFQDRNDLIEVITVAFKGLKPDATINQQNIAYYAVRSVLNQEE